MQGLCLWEAEFPKRGELREKSAEMWCAEQRHQHPQKTALNHLECAANSLPGQVQPPLSQWTKTLLSTSQCAPLTGIWLSRFFAHLHLPSVWFAAVPSKPPLLMWVYKHQDKLYRSNFFKMRHLYSALSWGALPATQATDFFFWSAGQAPSAGNYKSWFRAGFISILVKSLHPSRAFLFRLTCLLLTIR